MKPGITSWPAAAAVAAASSAHPPPAKTPPEIVKRMNEEINAALRQLEVWSKVVKDNGIKAD